MSPVVKLLVTFFLGGFGVHKFMEHKTGLGLLYLFTCGLFGIGWLVDCIRAFIACLTSHRSELSAQKLPAALVKPEPVQSTDPKATSAILMNMNIIHTCEKAFIAFDLETTGLSPECDRIIELSAVKFENGKAGETFSTLVNPGRQISAQITDITGITNQMVRNAPNEQTALADFVRFIGSDAVDGTVPLVAHNGIRFDIQFLLYACSRSGIDANFTIVDTLLWSRALLDDVENYKLGSLASYFAIEQQQAHRACDDASVCGRIFLRLMDLRRTAIESALHELTPAEQDFCIWIHKILSDAGEDVQLLTFYKASYLSAFCSSTFLKARPSAKKPFLVMDASTAVPANLESGPAVKSDGENKIRIFYNSLDDLQPLTSAIVTAYQIAYRSAEEYLESSNSHFKAYSKTTSHHISL